MTLFASICKEFFVVSNQNDCVINIIMFYGFYISPISQFYNIDLSLEVPIKRIKSILFLCIQY